MSILDFDDPMLAEFLAVVGPEIHTDKRTALNLLIRHVRSDERRQIAAEIIQGPPGLAIPILTGGRVPEMK